jgi:hypothetical protein
MLGAKDTLSGRDYYLYVDGGSFFIDGMEIHKGGVTKVAILRKDTEVVLQKVVRLSNRIGDVTSYVDRPIVSVTNPVNGAKVAAQTSFHFLENLSSLHKAGISLEQ